MAYACERFAASGEKPQSLLVVLIVVLAVVLLILLVFVILLVLAVLLTAVVLLVPVIVLIAHFIRSPLNFSPYILILRSQIIHNA